jgi:hypothetical protein
MAKGIRELTEMGQAGDDVLDGNMLFEGVPSGGAGSPDDEGILARKVRLDAIDQYLSAGGMDPDTEYSHTGTAIATARETAIVWADGKIGGNRNADGYFSDLAEGLKETAVSETTVVKALNKLKELLDTEAGTRADDDTAERTKRIAADGGEPDGDGNVAGIPDEFWEARFTGNEKKNIVTALQKVKAGMVNIKTHLENYYGKKEDGEGVAIAPFDPGDTFAQTIVNVYDDLTALKTLVGDADSYAGFDPSEHDVFRILAFLRDQVAGKMNKGPKAPLYEGGDAKLALAYDDTMFGVSEPEDEEEPANLIIKDGGVSTDKLADAAVTADKLAYDETVFAALDPVTEDDPAKLTLAEGGVTADKLAYDDETFAASVPETDGDPAKLILKDGGVSAEKLAFDDAVFEAAAPETLGAPLKLILKDGGVTADKLDTELKGTIDGKLEAVAVEAGGILTGDGTEDSPVSIDTVAAPFLSILKVAVPAEGDYTIHVDENGLVTLEAIT